MRLGDIVREYRLNHDCLWGTLRKNLVLASHTF